MYPEGYLRGTSRHRTASVPVWGTLPAALRGVESAVSAIAKLPALPILGIFPRAPRRGEGYASPKNSPSQYIAHIWQSSPLQRAFALSRGLACTPQRRVPRRMGLTDSFGIPSITPFQTRSKSSALASGLATSRGVYKKTPTAIKTLNNPNASRSKVNVNSQVSVMTPNAFPSPVSVIL
jgi:hypothetical protein